MFPLRIKLTKRVHLAGVGWPSEDFKVIISELQNLKVDKIEVEGTRIKFENYLFNKQGRTHLMATVDSGYFDHSNTGQSLIYQFSTRRLFFITLSMSLFFGLLSWSIGVALFFFAWLYGMNLIIALIRHKLFLKRLVRQIATRSSNSSPGWPKLPG
jgi:hypothetical protein